MRELARRSGASSKTMIAPGHPTTNMPPKTSTKAPTGAPTRTRASIGPPGKGGLSRLARNSRTTAERAPVTSEMRKARCGRNSSSTSPSAPAGTFHPCAQPSTVTAWSREPLIVALQPALLFSRTVSTESSGTVATSTTLLVRCQSSTVTGVLSSGLTD